MWFNYTLLNGMKKIETFAFDSSIVITSEAKNSHEISASNDTL